MIGQFIGKTPQHLEVSFVMSHNHGGEPINLPGQPVPDQPPSASQFVKPSQVGLVLRC